MKEKISTDFFNRVLASKVLLIYNVTKLQKYGEYSYE